MRDDWPTDEEMIDLYFVAARWPNPFPWDDVNVRGPEGSEVARP